MNRLLYRRSHFQIAVLAVFTGLLWAGTGWSSPEPRTRRSTTSGVRARIHTNDTGAIIVPRRPALTDEETAELQHILAALPARPAGGAGERLGVSDAEHMRAYFRAHIRRIRTLALREFDARWRGYCAAAGVPPTPENRRRLRRLVERQASFHDLAKMDDLVSEGLYRLLGHDIRSMPEGSERDAAVRLIALFNGIDDRIEEGIYRSSGEFCTARVRRIVAALVHGGDLADRGLSPSAAVELNKAIARISLRSDAALRGMLHRGPSDPVDLERHALRNMEESVLAGVVAPDEYRPELHPISDRPPAPAHLMSTGGRRPCPPSLRSVTGIR